MPKRASHLRHIILLKMKEPKLSYTFYSGDVWIYYLVIINPIHILFELDRYASVILSDTVPKVQFLCSNIERYSYKCTRKLYVLYSNVVQTETLQYIA